MNVFRFGPFLVKEGDSLWHGDALVPLSPLQMRLLCFFCRHPQQVLEKRQIALAVWGSADVSDVSLARAVHGLRTRLAVAGKPSDFIRNVYGRGYLMAQPVHLIDLPSRLSPGLPQTA